MSEVDIEITNFRPFIAKDGFEDAIKAIFTIKIPQLGLEVRRCSLIESGGQYFVNPPKLKFPGEFLAPVFIESASPLARCVIEEARAMLGSRGGK